MIYRQKNVKHTNLNIERASTHLQNIIKSLNKNKNNVLQNHIWGHFKILDLIIEMHYLSQILFLIFLGINISENQVIKIMISCSKFYIKKVIFREKIELLLFQNCNYLRRIVMHKLSTRALYYVRTDLH